MNKFLISIITFLTCVILPAMVSATTDFCDISSDYGIAVNENAIGVSSTNNRGFYFDTQNVQSIATATVYLKGTAGTGSLNIFAEAATTSPVRTFTFNANTSNVVQPFTFTIDLNTSTTSFYRFEFKNSVSTTFYISAKQMYNINPDKLETYYAIDGLCRNSENSADGLSVDIHHPRTIITGISKDELLTCELPCIEPSECEVCSDPIVYTNACQEFPYSQDLGIITGCTQELDNLTGSTTKVTIETYHIPFFIFIFLSFIFILFFSRFMIELVKRFKGNKNYEK